MKICLVKLMENKSPDHAKNAWLKEDGKVIPIYLVYLEWKNILNFLAGNEYNQDMIIGQTTDGYVKMMF